MIPYPEISLDFHIVAPTGEGCSPELNLGLEAGRLAIERLIRESGVKVVFFDTLYRFIRGLDPDDNMAMGELMGALNGLAQRTGAALVLIDHTRKGDGAATVSGSGIGAQIKGGAARVVIKEPATNQIERGWANRRQ